MKLYLAGPDVFRPDALAWAEASRRLCAAYGHQALIPLDAPVNTAQAIYASNIDLIHEADAVIANVNAFRGAEPDSGTCFEIGYAQALAKPVVLYLAAQQSVCERVAAWQGQALRFSAGHYFDRDGQQVEDFGLPVNLMLAIPCRVVIGGLAEALNAL